MGAYQVIGILKGVSQTCYTIRILKGGPKYCSRLLHSLTIISCWNHLTYDHRSYNNHSEEALQANCILAAFPPPPSESPSLNSMNPRLWLVNFTASRRQWDTHLSRDTVVVWVGTKFAMIRGPMHECRVDSCSSRGTRDGPCLFWNYEEGFCL